MDNTLVPKITYTVKEVIYACGFSRSKFYDEVARGKLKIHKLGSKTLVFTDDLNSYIRDNVTKTGQ